MNRFLRVLIVGVLAIGLLTSGLAGRSAMAYTVTEFGDGGFLNLDYSLQLRFSRSDIGSGTNLDDPTVNVYPRRNRFGVLGALNETFAFAVQYEYNGGRKINDVTVSKEATKWEGEAIDYYLAMYTADFLQFRAGKTKHVLTREVNEGCYEPLSIDRSVFINGPFKGKRTRDNGLVVWGNLASDLFQYRLAVMQGNNFGDNKPDGIGYRYSGRAHVSLFEPETSLGYRATYLGKKKVLTFGAGYETQPKAVYEAYGVSGPTGAADYSAFTYDGFFEYPTEMGTFTLSGAYLKADFNKAGLRGVPDAQEVDGEKNGSYWKAAYMLGKTQVYVRTEDWAFASLFGNADQNIKWNAGGVNYYIKGNDLRLTLEYAKTDYKKNDAVSRDFSVLTLQAQAKF